MHDSVEGARNRAKLKVLEERVEQLIGRIRTQADVIHMQCRRIKRLEEENCGLENAIEEAALALKEVYLAD